MRCGACGLASDAELQCPACGAGPAAAAAAPSVTSADAGGAVEAGVPRCAAHPAMGAPATCRRCGRFVCSRCTEAALRADTLTCPECVVAEVKQAAPGRLRRYGAQLIASWLLVAGALAVAVVGLLLFLGQDAATRRGVVLLLGPALGVLLVSTALFAVTRRLVFGWAATVMESLLLIPLLVTSPSWCTAALAAAPVFATVRLLQMQELRATT